MSYRGRGAKGSSNHRITGQKIQVQAVNLIVGGLILVLFSGCGVERVAVVGFGDKSDTISRRCGLDLIEV
jgi:hypothetical protein